MKLSHLAENLIGSEIIKIGNEVNDMKSRGADIANLTIGDLNSSLYPIPRKLREEIEKAYQNNLTNYPPANGLQSLREAVSSDLKSRWNLDYPAKDILVAGGSRPLIYAVYRTIVDPGDKVVYPIPSWNNNHYTFLTSGSAVEVETSVQNNFLPTADDLADKLNDAVLLALCSPLNPTGTMFTEEQLREICELVITENKKRTDGEKPLYIMYDQIYAMLTFGKKHVDPVSLYPELKPYTIYIDGISKCFAATGVRVGWSFGPSDVMDKMKSLLGHIGAWAPKPEQEATGIFLRDQSAVDAFVNDFKGSLQSSLFTLHEGIQTMKANGYKVDSLIPMGAMYLTVKLDYLGKKTPENTLINNTSDLVFYLIKEAQLALVPFSAFGNDRQVPWFRASVGGASKEEILHAFDCLKIALDNLS